MSTRTQIVIEDRAEPFGVPHVPPAKQVTLYPVKVYKHSDGYPSAVLPVLVPFAHSFIQTRGRDPEYMAAQVVRAFALAEEPKRLEWLAEMRKRYPDLISHYSSDRPDFLGWGVSTYWHEDIEWLYVLRESGTVDVYKVRYGQIKNRPREDQIPSGLKHVGSIPIGTDKTAEAWGADAIASRRALAMSDAGEKAAKEVRRWVNEADAAISSALDETGFLREAKTPEQRKAHADELLDHIDAVFEFLRYAQEHAEKLTDKRGKYYPAQHYR